MDLHASVDLPKLKDTHHVICSLGTTFRNKFVEPVEAEATALAGSGGSQSVVRLPAETEQRDEAGPVGALPPPDSDKT